MSIGRPKLIKPPATCHPERMAYTVTGGLCITCYKREWAKNKRKLNPPAPKIIKLRNATCHPDKRHWGKGLCIVCYFKKYREENREQTNNYSRKWRKNNKEKSWAHHLRYRYGLTVNDYNAILQEQNHSCKLCKANPIITPVVEHCHSTEQIRGIVCQRCNIAIGLFESYRDLLPKIPNYLENK